MRGWPMGKYSKPPEFKRIFLAGREIGTITFMGQLPADADGNIQIPDEEEPEDPTPRMSDEEFSRLLQKASGIMVP